MFLRIVVLTVTGIRNSAAPVLLAVCEFFRLAHALPVKSQVRSQLETSLYSPRLRVRFGILNCNCVAQSLMVDSPHPLHDMQRVAVRMAGPIQPSLIIKADRVDDQGTALPLAN